MSAVFKIKGAQPYSLSQTEIGLTAKCLPRISHKTLEKRGQKLPECMLQKNSSSFKYDPK